MRSDPIVEAIRILAARGRAIREARQKDAVSRVEFRGPDPETATVTTSQEAATQGAYNDDH